MAMTIVATHSAATVGSKNDSFTSTLVIRRRARERERETVVRVAKDRRAAAERMNSIEANGVAASRQGAARRQ